jgi:fibronectin-binding autotransporter adhesin
MGGAIFLMAGGTLTISGAGVVSDGTVTGGEGRRNGSLTTTGSVVDYANGVTIANPIVVNSNTTQFQVLDGTATQSGVISELNGPRPIEDRRRHVGAQRGEHV